MKFVVGDPIYLSTSEDKENEKPSSRGRFGVEIHASRLKGDPLFYPMEVGFRIFNKFVHEGRLTIQMKRRGIQIMLKDGKPEQIRTCLNVLAAFLRKRRESTAMRSSKTQTRAKCMFAIVYNECTTSCSRISGTVSNTFTYETTSDSHVTCVG